MLSRLVVSVGSGMLQTILAGAYNAEARLALAGRALSTPRRHRDGDVVI